MHVDQRDWPERDPVFMGPGSPLRFRRDDS